MLMAKSKELKSLLMKMKEESEKVVLKLNIQKLRSWHLVPLLMANRWRNNETVTLYFGGSKITADGDCSHVIKKILAPWKKSYD